MIRGRGSESSGARTPGKYQGASRKMIRVSIFICAPHSSGRYCGRLHVIIMDASSRGALGSQPSRAWPVRAIAALWPRPALFLGWLYLGIISKVEAAEWPMFRGGPALLGVAEGGLPDKLTQLWSFKTGSAVKSSAAIAQDRVFIGSSDQN